MFLNAGIYRTFCADLPDSEQQQMAYRESDGGLLCMPFCVLKLKLFISELLYLR